MNQAENVRDSANRVIDLINGKTDENMEYIEQYTNLNNHLSEKENIIRIREEIGDDELTRVERFKRIKDNFDDNNKQNGFSFFGNLPCKFYDKNKYDSLGDITKKNIDETILSEQSNDNMKYKNRLLGGSLIRSLLEKFVKY